MRLLFALAVVAILAGCSPKPGPAAGPAAPNSAVANRGSSGAPAANNGQIKAALVLDTGGIDDKSFNAAAYEGIERAQRELGIEDRYLESKDPADYKTNLTQFAEQGYDVIFAVGYKMEDALKEVAPQYPNIKFAIVDGDAPPGAPNCAALKFREEQGTFLAGFLAASMSKSKTIGFVGGEDIPLIRKFEAGYRAGAKMADPNVKVISAYTNDWNDLNKGKSQAMLQFANGADIVMHAAGKCGVGVIEAAKEKGEGFYAIGVDRDQDGEAPGRVLTSMVKRLDNAVFDTCKRVKEGRFESGPQMYDLKAGGVGLSPMKYTKQAIPSDVLVKLDKVTEMVSNGTIVPPTTVDAVASFVPPKL